MNSVERRIYRITLKKHEKINIKKNTKKITTHPWVIKICLMKT